MLVATHGEESEAIANERLNDAQEGGREGDEIVWRGILTQLEKIRSGSGT